MQRGHLVLGVALLAAGCSTVTPPRPEEGRHLDPGPDRSRGIPAIVQQHPPLVPPEPEPPLDLYTVVVQDVPVKGLLFALARDSGLNIDVHPEISGRVTLNAIDQTLLQILDRIGRQLSIRYHLEDGLLVVQPDHPYLRTYKVDYVNIDRTASGAIGVTTEVGGRTSTNNSSATLEQASTNRFWQTLVQNIRGIIGESGARPNAGAYLGSPDIVVNREAGVVTIRATGREHDQVQHFLDQVQARARHQVLIEVTVVEVQLSDRYQAGVDWSMFDQDNDGVSVVQELTGANLDNPPFFSLTLDKTRKDNLFATIKLLEQFGDMKVLSSPKLMVLNNQTSMLKVVDNRVYFTIEVDITPPTEASPAIVTYESSVHTVPVGFVMSVTPQISDSDEVTINVRPTISRVVNFIQDPNPALADAGVVSMVPEIQIREIESILRVDSGQIAVLGGLMQDTVDRQRSGVPGLSDLPLAGNLFSYRDENVRKTELVIFLRPSVIRHPGLDNRFRRYLRPERMSEASNMPWRIFEGEGAT